MPGGTQVYRSPAAPLVVEYCERRRLAELGLQSRLDALPAWKVDALLVIDQKFEELQAAKIKRKRG